MDVAEEPSERIWGSPGAPTRPGSWGGALRAGLPCDAAWGFLGWSARWLCLKFLILWPRQFFKLVESQPSLGP